MPTPHALGYQWRYDVQKFLAAYGIKLHARELGASGDDLFNEMVSIECKNRKAFAPAEWLDQAEANAGDKVPIVVAKRRGHGPAEGYAIMRLEDLALLLKQVQT